MDGVARGRQRPDHRTPAVRPHLQGRPVADVGRIPGVLGSGHRRAALGRRGRAHHHQRVEADHRDLHLRRRADPAEPAVPRRRRHRHLGELAGQQFHLLA